jgi:hypothetical protein
VIQAKHTAVEPSWSGLAFVLLVLRNIDEGFIHPEGGDMLNVIGNLVLRGAGRDRYADWAEGGESTLPACSGCCHPPASGRPRSTNRRRCSDALGLFRTPLLGRWAALDQHRCSRLPQLMGPQKADT